MKLAPSEFWAMTISEFMHLMEWRRPRTENDYAGKLTRGAVEDLREWMRGK
jgi:hypothetical protein